MRKLSRKVLKLSPTGENEGNFRAWTPLLCIITLQDGGLATIATEMVQLITSAQNLYTNGSSW